MLIHISEAFWKTLLPNRGMVKNQRINSNMKINHQQNTKNTNENSKKKTHTESI